MIEDAVKWNKKYKTKIGDSGTVDSFFVDKLSYLRGSTILDLAGGDGKNSLFLAAKNYEVTLLDISKEALSRVDSFCSTSTLDIATILMDLDDLDSFSRLDSFDNIIMSFYKPSTKLFQQLYTKLKPKGRVFLHTYGLQQHTALGFSRRFCLENEEYLNISPQLKLIRHDVFESKSNFLECYIFEKIAHDL